MLCLIDIYLDRVRVSEAGLPRAAESLAGPERARKAGRAHAVNEILTPHGYGDRLGGKSGNLKPLPDCPKFFLIGVGIHTNLHNRTMILSDKGKGVCRVNTLQRVRDLLCFSGEFLE
jgi:hypothetical protein